MHIWGKPLPRDLLAEGPLSPARNGASSGHWTHRRSAVVPPQGRGGLSRTMTVTLRPYLLASSYPSLVRGRLRLFVMWIMGGFHQSVDPGNQGKLGKVSFGVEFTFLLGFPRRCSVLRCCIDQRK